LDFKVAKSLQKAVNKKTLAGQHVHYFGQHQSDFYQLRRKADSAFIYRFDEEMNCYVYQNWPNQCLVQLSESSVSITAWRKTASFRLDETGVLIGDMLVDNLTPAATTTIPVRQ
jgi:hypothetical protein